MTASTKNRSSHRATTTMVNSSYTMADAVFTACFLNTCLRNCDIVDITVTKDENGYAVATVNKDPKESQTVSLRILDDTCSKMRIHTVNGPSGSIRPRSA